MSHKETSQGRATNKSPAAAAVQHERSRSLEVLSDEETAEEDGEGRVSIQTNIFFHFREPRQCRYQA